MCLGRHTITGLLSTCGLQFRDWSAAYRLFSQARLNTDHLFAGVRQAVLQHPSADNILCISVDDTLLRKVGRHIHGVSWRRDPLGPPFQTNLIRAQRFLQFSAAVPLPGPDPVTRMVPIDFTHAPTPAHPKKDATAEVTKAYQTALKQSNLCVRAVARMHAIQQSMCPPQAASVPLIHELGDGGYTNRTIFHGLTPGIVFTGRIRKDAKLYYPVQPTSLSGRGRTRRYGERAPTPEQLRQDESVAWESVSVFAAGAWHECRVKVLSNVLWRAAGADRKLRLIVIAPLGYRSRKGAKLLYRQPAYLISTALQLTVQQIVQQYMQRWDIEVNFREEKTLIGAGQAQVRTPASAAAVPATLVAAYAMLQLAVVRCGGTHPGFLPPPKWSAKTHRVRLSTQDALHQLRAEAWGRGLGLRNFSGFVNDTKPDLKPENFHPPLYSALLYSNA